MTRWLRPFLAALALVAIGLACVALGKVFTDPEVSPKDQLPGTASASLRIVDGDLAVLRPDGCEEFASPQGSVSAHIPGAIVENQGDQALVISTEFRVFVGEQEWNSTRTWRVPVGEQIADVQLFVQGATDRGLQTIAPGISRCILFVQREGTYLPPIEGPPPRGAGAEIGVAYDYTWYTHCGATILAFDGRWWKPSPPLSDDPHNPPPGWDENAERGRIALIERNRARFTTDRGNVANLVPTATPKQDPFGGCE